MNKEVEQHPKTEVFTNMLARAFVQRTDLYSRQLEDGSYVCIHKPLQDQHLLRHLKGEITLGTYCLDQESKTLLCGCGCRQRPPVGAPGGHRPWFGRNRRSCVP